MAAGEVSRGGLSVITLRWRMVGRDEMLAMMFIPIKTAEAMYTMQTQRPAVVSGEGAP